MKHPIPSDALDDRLAFVGNSGSGKSYNATANVERGIRAGHRTGIVDPTGVWHGLRLLEDGKTPSGLDVVIFGGKHGDLPLTEHSGALIGETVAGMRESFILDLKLLGSKAAERRFMHAFTTALYRRKVDNEADLLTFVVDEADMFAPQQLTDKEGGAAQLLGMMETIVRRGRIDGFIPWLISQRPAVLNKNVLSQVDGLVIFKLTSSQDRDAIGNWVKGQADMAQWRALYGQLSELPTGTGLVWIPSRKVFEIAKFPPKKTFDSMRSPKRGEKRAAIELKPLDLGKLKERLAKVDAEVKANDPKALKATIADLRKQLTAAERAIPVPIPPVVETGPSPEQINALVAEAEEAAKALGRHEGRVEYAMELLVKIKEFEALGIKDLAKAIDRLAAALEADTQARAPKAKPARGVHRPAPQYTPQAAVPVTHAASGPSAGSSPPPDGITGPQFKLLGALAWWLARGIVEPKRPQLAAIAKWAPSGSNLKDRLSELKKAGLIEYPRDGFVRLTDAGKKVAPAPDMGANMIDGIRDVLTGPQKTAFNALLDLGGRADRQALAERIGWEPNGSNLKDRLSELKRLDVVTYPERGSVAISDWLQEG